MSVSPLWLDRTIATWKSSWWTTPPTTERARNSASVEGRWRVFYNQSNLGFAAGQNQAMRASKGEWVLCLNPDVISRPDFVSKLVAAGDQHPEAGTVCGKLLRWNLDGRAADARRT